MPNEDGTLTQGEMKDIDQNRRILAERATEGILDLLQATAVDRLQTEHLRRALAKAYMEGQDEQRSRHRNIENALATEEKQAASDRFDKQLLG